MKAWDRGVLVYIHSWCNLFSAELSVMQNNQSQRETREFLSWRAIKSTSADVSLGQDLGLESGSLTWEIIFSKQKYFCTILDGPTFGGSNRSDMINWYFSWHSWYAFKSPLYRSITTAIQLFSCISRENLDLFSLICILWYAEKCFRNLLSIISVRQIFT